MLEFFRESVESIRLPVNQKGRFGFLGKRFKPSDQIGLIAMGGEAVDHGDFGVDGDGFPVDLHFLGTLLEMPSPRALGLIAHQKDRVSGIRQTADEMMKDPSA